MRALLYETMTGNPVMDLQVTDWSYDTGICAPDVLEVTVPAYNRWAQSLNLKELLVADKRSIALIDESVEGERVVPAAGVLSAPAPNESNDGKHTYKVRCRGIDAKTLDRRRVRLFPGWPLLNSSGLPTGLYDPTFANLSYGTIMKRLITESMKFPGGALPIMFEADRPGVHERSEYKAIDGKSVIDVINQLADLSDGVEYDFETRIDEYDRITHLFKTGTDADRIIAGGVERVWNLGGPRPDASGYEREPFDGPFVSDAIFSGGKDGDKVMLAKAEDHSKIALGFPRAEVWDNSHSSVSVQATLQSWADGALGGGRDKISVNVKAELAHNIRHGDRALLSVQGHWDMPDGDYPVRVLSAARKAADPDWVSVSLI